MEPTWRALFIAAAIIVWLIGAFRPEHGRFALTSTQLACVGWALFAFPFLYDAVADI